LDDCFYVGIDEDLWIVFEGEECVGGCDGFCCVFFCLVNG